MAGDTLGINVGLISKFEKVAISMIRKQHALYMTRNNLVSDTKANPGDSDSNIYFQTKYTLCWMYSSLG